MKKIKPGIVIVCGATATGKTAMAVKIARRFHGEVVNADSMQVYRKLNIGTAKPTLKEQSQAKFYLVDVANPDETYSAGRFKKEADDAIATIIGKGMLPVVAGGTGLYLKALTQGIFEGPQADDELREELMAQEQARPGYLHEQLTGIDPEKAAALPPTDLGRIVRALEVYQLTGITLSEHQRRHAFAEKPYQVCWIGLDLDRVALYERIDKRVLVMMEQGWLDEVKRLKEEGFGEKGAAANALGYRTLMAHLRGEISLDEAVTQIQKDTRKFAKRQLTWYRANPEIKWFEYPKQEDEITGHVQSVLENWHSEQGRIE